MKPFKVVRRFLWEPPVIEESFNTRKEAEEYIQDTKEQVRSIVGYIPFMVADYSIETGDLNYKTEEDF